MKAPLLAKAVCAPPPGAPSASVGLTLRLAPGSPPRCGRARLPLVLIIKGAKPFRELLFNQVKIPTPDRSKYGFCGHKCRPTLCVALTGEPACRSALPRTPLLPRKNSVGLFGEGKSGADCVIADLRMGSPQGRKTLRGKEDAPQRRGLPEAKRRVSTTGAEVASDAKACVLVKRRDILNRTHGSRRSRSAPPAGRQSGSRQCRLEPFPADFPAGHGPPGGPPPPPHQRE